MNDMTSNPSRTAGKRPAASLSQFGVRWDRAALIAVMLTVWTFVLKFVAGL